MTTTIGILGAGQLARMTAQAATRLGLKVAVFAPEPLAPAFETAQTIFRAEYDDHKILKRFAQRCQVVTCEFENIPTTTLAFVESLTPLHPSTRVFATAQDRIAEKTFLNACGIPTTQFYPVSSSKDLAVAGETIPFPALLKRAHGGYDGKGQFLIERQDDLANAWQQIQAPAVLEQKLDLKSEFSLIAARSTKGEVAFFDATENQHENGILRESRAPADITDDMLQTARRWSEALLRAFNLVGLLTVEFFITSDDTLLANEIAPRPHNSGHWTIDAAPTSQFEQLLRAILGWPLGNTQPAARARMVNLIGEAWRDYPQLLEKTDACLHLYAKRETRQGRKMGHVTFRSF